MVVNFSVPDKFNPSKNFTKVIFGEDAPLLEVELNELQEIQEHFKKAIVKNIFGKENGMIKGEIVLNGLALNLTNTSFLYDGNIIDSGDLTINVAVGNTVYLAVWEQEITSTSTIYKDGNVRKGATIANDLKDSRIGLETSRRLQLLFDLTTSNTNTSRGYITLGVVTSSGFNSSVKSVSSGGVKSIQSLPHNAPMKDIPLGTSTFIVGSSSVSYPYPNSIVITDKVDETFVHQNLFAKDGSKLKHFERIYMNGAFSNWEELSYVNDDSELENNLNQKIDNLEITISNNIETANDNYNEYSSYKDEGGIYTVAEIRRKLDDTLYQRSTLTSKSSTGNYLKQTIETFKVDGTTLVKREEYALMYDSDGILIQRKLSRQEVY